MRSLFLQILVVCRNRISVSRKYIPTLNRPRRRLPIVWINWVMICGPRVCRHLIPSYSGEGKLLSVSKLNLKQPTVGAFRANVLSNTINISTINSMNLCSRGSLCCQDIFFRFSVSLLNILMIQLCLVLIINYNKTNQQTINICIPVFLITLCYLEATTLHNSWTVQILNLKSCSSFLLVFSRKVPYPVSFLHRYRGGTYESEKQRLPVRFVQQQKKTKKKKLL